MYFIDEKIVLRTVFDFVIEIGRKINRVSILDVVYVVEGQLNDVVTIHTRGKKVIFKEVK